MNVLSNTVYWGVLISIGSYLLGKYLQKVSYNFIQSIVIFNSFYCGISSCFQN